MASLISPSLSPTSLQLRFDCRCRRSSPLILRFRFRPSRRRLSLCFFAGAHGESGSGASGSPDSFAGWSDEGIDGDESKKGVSGGFVGIGLAGVLFAAGVTFATLSFTNVTTSRRKQHMQPLMVEQEVLLSASDDAIQKDENVGEESSVSVPQTESTMIEKTPENKKVTYQDLIAAAIKEDVSERPGKIQKSEIPLLENFDSADKNFNIIKTASVHDDLEGNQDRNIDPVPTGFSDSPSELQGDTFVSSSYTSTSNSDFALSSYVESITAHNVDIDNTKTPIDPSSVNTDPLSQDNYPELIINPRTETPLQLPGVVNDQITHHSVASSVVALESSDRIDFQSSFAADAAATALSASIVQDNEQNLQLPIEPSSNHPVTHYIKEVTSESDVVSDTVTSDSQFQSVSDPEGKKLNESGPSVANSASESTYTSEKEVKVKSDIENDRLSLFDSVLPKKIRGIPAPSLVSAAMQVPPTGKVLVSPVIDQVQGQALAALQVLKVIEADVQPGDLCSRREYARWLVSASSVLSRNTASKVYPAMYIENVTELAFDDVTPNNPDFAYIQGLAEAGIISSKLSISDLSGVETGQRDNILFFPDSPVSRQDLVSWKMVLERRELPEVDKNGFFHCTGYLDFDKINPDAWPALVADLNSGEQGITALAFGFTRLFQPDKPVTKAQAAIAIAIGDAAEVVSEELARIEAESLAETAVNAHSALVAEVEQEINASFKEELAREREKIQTLEKLSEETRLELERLRKQREEENIDLIRSRATVESEMEVLSRLRHEVEEQLQSVMSKKIEVSFERERINKLRDEVETENSVIVKLQYELEVERRALYMARAWAEEEAKRAREQARALEEARERWEKHGIKVVVDGDLQSDATFEPTWVTAGEQYSTAETIDKGEKLVKKLQDMAAEIKLRSSMAIQSIIKKINAYISVLKQQILQVPRHGIELRNSLLSKAKTSINSLQESTSELNSAIGDRTRKVVEDCREGIEKITQRFKT